MAALCVGRESERDGSDMRFDGGCGYAGSSAMAAIWRAAWYGDMDEVERLLGHDPGLLDSKDEKFGETPLMVASQEGHVGMVRWLLDKGAAINERNSRGETAVLRSCRKGRTPVARLLLERGADPTIADSGGRTPLITTSCYGHVEVVRLLLGDPSVKATINTCNQCGVTALWEACMWGHGGVARVLLESGADPTIATDGGLTPMAIATEMNLDEDEVAFGVTAEGRRDCVAALEVRSRLLLSPSPSPLS
jgi:uncharacterized protein